MGEIIHNPMQHPDDNCRHDDIETVVVVNAVDSDRKEGHHQAVEDGWLPSKVLLGSFLLAFVYTILPCSNYWIYFMIKNQFWGILNLVLIVELYSFNIPRLSAKSYVSAYLLGVLLAPFTHIVRFVLHDSKHQLEISALSNAFSVITTLSIFAYDCFQSLPAGHCSPPPAIHNNNNTTTSQERSSEVTKDTEGRDDSIAFTCMMEATGLHTPVSTGSDNSIVALEMGPTTHTDSEIDEEEEQNTSLPSSNSMGHDHRNNARSSNSLEDLFFFLPKFYRARLRPRRVSDGSDMRRRWLATTAFIILYNINYTFLIYFTNYFRFHANKKQSTGDADFHQLAWFVLYIVLGTVFRMSMKSCGLYLDRNDAHKTFSMFFIGEIMALMFYYTFYRVLFESIHNVSEFAMFQVLHLASEWTLYVVRSHGRYYEHSEVLLSRYCPDALLTKPRISHKHWVELIALDFGIRCTIFVATGYGMLLLLLAVQFFPWVNSFNALSQGKVEFQTTCGLIVVAVGCEALNAWIMNEVYFKPRHFDIVRIVGHCFSSWEFSLLAMLIGANLYINPIFAFTSVSFST